MSDTAHAAVVLAAGGSTRLGRPKQLLARDGEPMVHRAARMALATSPAQVIVVVGSERDAVAYAVLNLDCTVVDNPHWAEGLSSSLRAAAAHLRPDVSRVLVLSCDQPAVEIHHLLTLVQEAKSAASGCAATMHGALRGVPAVVPSAWFDSALRDGDAGFGRRLRQQPDGAVFGLRATDLALDIDTPGDLQRAVALGWLDAAQ